MPPSASETVHEKKLSPGFSLLHKRIQRWMWEQGWTELRNVQEAAVQHVLQGEDDVIIAAATATGKTEAAFLPILSRMLYTGTECVIYVSPLKALINDQFDRIGQLCDQLNIPVHPWHGDISSRRKKTFLKNSLGILLITPESLEALLILNGHSIPALFSHLSYVVIDELHTFIGHERGRQLQSIMHRIDCATDRTATRIGLSATLGDMRLAAEFLRPGKGDTVKIISSDGGGHGLKLVVQGYVEKVRLKEHFDENEATISEDEAADLGGIRAMAADLFSAFYGKTNLFFTNRRADVEYFADILRQECHKQGLPNEFWAHHGSLSSEIREAAERAVKERTRPATVICTSTLEMGIDVGSVQSIAQVGSPPSVASMRQRLGRSGRRGEPSVLRMYVYESAITANSSLIDKLHIELVQAIAMIRLLLAKWYEPPAVGKLHLSTLLQQTMALIAQLGGITASQAWRVLCETGPFKSVDQKMYMSLLRAMGTRNLIIQGGDGTLLHGEVGEKIVNNHEFYAVFQSSEDFRILDGSRPMGTLPIKSPLKQGSFLIFGGRRWVVVTVDEKKRVVCVEPSSSGRVPRFNGSMATVHDRVRQEMKLVYEDCNLPKFLKNTATELLIQARQEYVGYQLIYRRIVADGKDTLVFVWRGDRIMQTMTLALGKMGYQVSQEQFTIRFHDTRPEKVWHSLKLLQEQGLPSMSELAGSVENKIRAKYDRFLSPELLNVDFAAGTFDMAGTEEAIKEICNHG